MNYTATVAEKKTIIVRDALHDTLEVLELPERVIQLSLRYSHLVATTPTQCYIYSASNWNTPTIFDLKDGSIILLLLCEKFVSEPKLNNIHILHNMHVNILGISY